VVNVSQRTAEQYVYAVVPSRAPAPTGNGIGRRRLRTVTAGEVAAIVSDAPAGEIQADREDLMAHSRVVEKALGRASVLPMRFGVVMPDADSVREQLLEEFHDELLAQLVELEGKVELHVQAVYEEEVLLREVLQAHPELRARGAALRGHPEDATYYERIELGQLVAQAAESARELDAAAILEALEPLAVAIDVGSPGHERVAAQVAFLVEAARLEEFDAVVDDLGRRNQGRLRFKYTGPLPAYSFVRLPAQV
jgi:hypothetical protein